MSNARKITVSTFSALAAAAGIEHGLGEILQGNHPPDGMFIQSWPNSEFFRIMNGEPAMTLIPNLLVSGILAILAALAFLAWALFFVERKGGGLVLILLSILMLLAGGGFGPPLMGIILGIGALGMRRAPTPGRPPGAQRFAGRRWAWFYAVCLASWLLLLPGLNLIDYFFGVRDPMLVMTVAPLSAFGLLVLTLVLAVLHDRGGPKNAAGG